MTITGNRAPKRIDYTAAQVETLAGKLADESRHRCAAERRMSVLKEENSRRSSSVECIPTVTVREVRVNLLYRTFTRSDALVAPHMNTLPTDVWQPRPTVSHAKRQKALTVSAQER